ncbi:MAG TPA: matrixin family metalloprotease [Gemmatimonadaceae bacterium]|nr:matrixin family metalloprotease [Gemmatimonadaceae bacterium]
MRLPSLPRLLGLVLLGLTAFVVLETASVRRKGYDLSPARLAADSVQQSADAAQPLAAELRSARIDSDAGDSIRRADTRALIDSRSTGTFIPDILLLSDSTLQRWPDRRATPLRVFVSDQGPARTGQVREDYLQAVREAFTIWEGVELPIRFVFVTDSSLADITVAWVADFRGDPVLGRTKVVRDSRYWIIRAEVQLAMVRRDASGPLDPTVVRALAIHEIGHGIGLDHASDTTTIMAPKIRARALTLADKATAQLLYSVPPGSVVTRRRASQPQPPALPSP